MQVGGEGPGHRVWNLKNRLPESKYCPRSSDYPCKPKDLTSWGGEFLWRLDVLMRAPHPRIWVPGRTDLKACRSLRPVLLPL